MASLTAQDIHLVTAELLEGAKPFQHVDRCRRSVHIATSVQRQESERDCVWADPVDSKYDLLRLSDRFLPLAERADRYV